MANSIDFTTLAVGALIGVGCHRELRSAAKVAATTAASLASSVAVAVHSAAAQMYEDPKAEPQQPQVLQGQAGQGNGNGN